MHKRHACLYRHYYKIYIFLCSSAEFLEGAGRIILSMRCLLNISIQMAVTFLFSQLTLEIFFWHQTIYHVGSGSLIQKYYKIQLTNIFSYIKHIDKYYCKIHSFLSDQRGNLNSKQVSLPQLFIFYCSENHINVLAKRQLTCLNLWYNLHVYRPNLFFFIMSLVQSSCVF